jgi:ATP-dependent Clp protease adaptor protein ClpS
MGQETMSTVIDVEEKVSNEVDTSLSPKIVLFNDDHNSFDHVIRCLVQYCNHGLIQAEQCALIVHTKGKCDIKHGSLDELLPINDILGLHDLTTEIQL